MLTFKEYFFESTRIDIKRADVMKVLNSMDNSVVDKELTPKGLAQKFVRPLRKIVSCDITTGTDHNVSRNMVLVNGYFDETMEEDETQFEFVFLFNPKDVKIKITPKYWKWFKEEIADAVVHELYHQGQARSRFYEDPREYKGSSKDDSYYGKPDEIEAYAMNASLELKRAYKTKSAVQRALSNIASIDGKKSQSLNTYIGIYQSPDHPVMKRFLKKLYQFLDEEI